MKNLFLAKSVEDTVSLVLCQLIIFKNFFIFLITCWILIKLVLSYLANLCPCFDFVSDAHGLNLRTFKYILNIKIVWIIWILLLILSSLLCFNNSLVFLKIEHCHVFIEDDISWPRNEFFHNFFIKIINNSKFHKSFFFVDQFLL